MAVEMALALVDVLASECSKGKIHITTEKPAYYPGEIVNGNVYCNIREPIKCEKIVVKCKGEEKIFWQEINRSSNTGGGRGGSRSAGGKRRHARHNKQDTDVVSFEAKRNIFATTIVLSDVKSEIPVGQWIYHFSFQLPLGIPPSFEYKGGSWAEEHFLKAQEDKKIDQNTTATIQYTFKGTVEVKGIFAKDLRGIVEVSVMDVPLNTFPPAKMKTERPVLMFCCISKGIVKIDVELDKGAYIVGETAQIHVNIKNDSSVDISKVKAKLYGELTLKKDNSKKQIKHVMNELKCESVKGGESTDEQKMLSIQGVFLPQVDSKHISCRYYVEINCTIPWCPGAVLQSPLCLHEKPQQLLGCTPPDGVELYRPAPPM